MALADRVALKSSEAQVARAVLAAQKELTSQQLEQH